MWCGAWRSLGRAAGVAARFAKGASGSGKVIGRALRGTIRAGDSMAEAMPRYGLAAARFSGAASAALQRRTILVCSGARASLAALAQMALSRRGQSPSIKVVEEQAEGIAKVLRERDVSVSRIGIDGIPGSGKSSLAAALAEKLDMGWRTLDYHDLGLGGILRRKRTIYEHYRLFRTQDLDAFDVIVYIDEPPERSLARVRRRGRGLVLAALLDYDKLKKVGELAFEVCGGEPVAVDGGPAVLKIRPPEGFRAMENIASRLSAAGSDVAEANGTSREEMLLFLACGVRQKGLSAYFLPLAQIVGGLAARFRSAGRRLLTIAFG